MTSFIPFFVADRPMSLFILKTSDFQEFEHPMGIMSHAHTTERFRKLFRDYPCDQSEVCIINDNCDFPNSICKKGQIIRNLTIKICDSGAFHKNGKLLSYESLFKTYESMGTEYGIIYDYIRNKEMTIKSAEEALGKYNEGHYSFKIIGVAQGKTKNEYLECYQELKKIGYEYIAIGGLLNNHKTTRFSSVNEEYMIEVIEKIRTQFPEDWLFALGCNNHKRISLFKSESLNLYGSDSKGWIFKYEKSNSIKSREEARDNRISQVHNYIINNIYSQLTT